VADKRQAFVGEDDDRFLPIVPFLPFRCPRCHSAKPRTYSVRSDTDTPTTRHHRCQSCGQRYRSVELKRDDLRSWVERNEP